MAITNREALAGGQTLVARYKGKTHTVLVKEDDGTLTFEVGGTTYKSLSSAGSAVMGGTACNGWRFWSFEGDAPPAREKKPEAEKGTKAAKPKALKNLKKLPTKAKDGNERWFCSCCQAGFAVPEGTEPEQCPEGHPMTVEDELAPPA
jgi:hypothetical protein